MNAAGEEVALKVMLPEVASDELASARFVREARAVSRLRHRNIISVLDAGLHEGAPYIAMELLQGKTLEAHLSSREAMSTQTKLDIVIQLCEALQFAHDHGIVHRDVKPANLSLLSDGRLKLFDFGVAKVTGATHTRIGDVVGSVAYMSPEQLAGEEVDGRTDVFSAGAILYELLAGRRPYEADHLSAVMNKILHEDPPPLRRFAPHVTPEIVLAVETALQRDLSLRYGQASDFGTDLRLARYGLEQERVDATIVVQETRPGGEEPIAAPCAPPAPAEPPASMSASASAVTVLVHATSVPVPVAVPLPVAVPAVDARPGHEPRTGPWIEALTPGMRNGLIGGGVVVALLVLAFSLRTPAVHQQVAIALTVRSEPEGANVAFDGADAGQKTPATISVPTLPKRVRLTLAGFRSIESAVPEGIGSGQTLHFQLQRVLRVVSDPPGARVVVGGVDTGLVTPTEVPLPDPVPATIELVIPKRGRRVLSITPAVLTLGEVRASFDGSGRDPGPVPVPVLPAGATIPPEVVPAAGPALVPLPATTVASSPVVVHLLGGYPFDVAGCGHSGAAASEHTLQVQAPCTLRLRAPVYFLDVSRRIDASSGQVEIVAPQLARVQMRSRYEWCTLIINGRAVGAPPVDVDLVAGTYAATIQCPDKSHSIPAMTIEPGRYVRRLDEFLR